MSHFHYLHLHKNKLFQMMVLLRNLCCGFYNRYFFRHATITSLPVLLEMVFIQQKFAMPCKSAKLSKLPRHTPEMQTAHAQKLASAQSSLTVTTKSSESSHKTVDCRETILFSHVEKHFQTSVSIDIDVFCNGDLNKGKYRLREQTIFSKLNHPRWVKTRENFRLQQVRKMLQLVDHSTLTYSCCFFDKIVDSTTE